MDPLQIIEKLKGHGLSEYAIAKRSKELGRPVSQSTVNRIATGEVTNISLDTLRSLEYVLAELAKPCIGRRSHSSASV